MENGPEHSYACSVRVKTGELVSLGHGTWVRSDEVVAVEPIREQRGPGRRALVWVKGLPEPLVASRSEDALLRSLGAADGASRQALLHGTLQRMTAAVDRIPPVLLRVVEQETGEDLRSIASDAKDQLR
jgi:hypothetical protein